jgi:hypothetical protein
MAVFFRIVTTGISWARQVGFSFSKRPESTSKVNLRTIGHLLEGVGKV